MRYKKGRLRGYIYKSLKVTIFLISAGRNITNKLPSTSPIEYWFQLQPATTTASTTVTTELQLLFASQPAPTTGMHLIYFILFHIFYMKKYMSHIIWPI